MRQLQLAVRWVAMVSLGCVTGAATLSGVAETAATLEVSAWQFRKPVGVTSGEVHRLELDVETIAHARPDFGDLRLMRGGVQVAYLRDAAASILGIRPTVAGADDSKRPRVSRWQLTLPHAGLPLTGLVCDSSTALFRREVELYEEVSDDRRGGRYRRVLGRAVWSHTPGQPVLPLTLQLGDHPESDTLFLEAGNEDNSPIVLERFEFAATAPRLSFKLTGPVEDLFLYFGNPEAVAPSYDLALMAAEVATASKCIATLGPMEELRPGSGWRRNGGSPGRWFWLVLVLVVVSLGAMIVRLLPKPEEGTPAG